jgi:hypothetical protein
MVEDHDMIKLSHQPYHPDLSLAVFRLCNGIKVTPEELFFQDINEVKNGIVQILRPIPLGTSLRVFDEWKERLAV